MMQKSYREELVGVFGDPIDEKSNRYFRTSCFSGVPVKLPVFKYFGKIRGSGASYPWYESNAYERD